MTPIEPYQEGVLIAISSSLGANDDIASAIVVDAIDIMSMP
jgi:hypothetical protein